MRDMGERLQEQKWLKGSYITKTCSRLADTLQKLETWNSLHSLQTVQQAGELSFPGGLLLWAHSW